MLRWGLASLLLLSARVPALRLAPSWRLARRPGFTARCCSSGSGSIEAVALVRSYIRGRSLFVGEGDLGFSSFVCRALPEVQCTSSTWDTPSRLETSFGNASSNVQSIVACGGRVLFEVDATKLAETFADERFDTIVWMFPHVPGKQNIKRNRLLLHDFFSSAKSVLAPDGHVVLALAEGQSGFSDLTSNQDWLHSWKLSAASSEAGLLVTSHQNLSLEILTAEGYSPKGHRGHGGWFPTRRAEIFRLESPRNESLAVQAPVFVHEVHLLAADMRESAPLEAAVSEAVRSLLSEQDLPPALWSAHMVDLYVDKQSGLVSHTLQLAYCSTTHAVGRSAADDMRSVVEALLPLRVGLQLRAEKAGGKVSKAHCWPIALALKEGSGGVVYEKTELTASAMSAALRELEPQQQQKNPAALRAHQNGDLVKQAQDALWGKERADEIRKEARRLWQRRVGVLIHDVGHTHTVL